MIRFGQSTFQFPIKRHCAINFPSISGTTWPLACPSHLFFSFLFFLFSRTPDVRARLCTCVCYLRILSSHVTFTTGQNFAPHRPRWCSASHRLAFLWGFARRACTAAITVPRYVTRSHLSRFGWTKGCTTGRSSSAAAVDNNNNNNAGKIRPGGGSGRCHPISDFRDGETGTLGFLVSFASATYSERSDAQGDGLSPGLDYFGLRTTWNSAFIGTVAHTVRTGRIRRDSNSVVKIV